MIHFRLASVGEVTPKLCHPFPITACATTRLSGHARAALFHNGTWSSWRETLRRMPRHHRPDGLMSDTRVAASLVDLCGMDVLDRLPGRWVFCDRDFTELYGDRRMYPLQRNHEPTNRYHETHLQTDSKSWQRDRVRCLHPIRHSPRCSPGIEETARPHLSKRHRLFDHRNPRGSDPRDRGHQDSIALPAGSQRKSLRDWRILGKKLFREEYRVFLTRKRGVR